MVDLLAFLTFFCVLAIPLVFSGFVVLQAKQRKLAADIERRNLLHQLSRGNTRR
jgi:hypothetical protein